MDDSAGRSVGATGQLSVQADLNITMDGVESRLYGDGRVLVLESDAPLAMWDSLNASALPSGIAGANGPRAVGRLGAALASSGLRLDVRGPQGTVASLGTGVSSSIGRIVTGSRSVAPGRPAAVGPLIWHRVRQQPRALFGSALAVVAAAGWAVARRRRSR